AGRGHGRGAVPAPRPRPRCRPARRWAQSCDPCAMALRVVARAHSTGRAKGHGLRAALTPVAARRTREMTRPGNDGGAPADRRGRSMDAQSLRALPAPLKNSYRENAEAALITLKARGALDEANIACKVETGRALAVAGLHPATGGTGLELCSGDMLLEALVACAGVTLKAVATALEIPLRSG